MDRRSFLKSLFGASVAAVVAPSVVAGVLAEPTKAVPITAHVSSPLRVGGFIRASDEQVARMLRKAADPEQEAALRKLGLILSRS